MTQSIDAAKMTKRGILASDMLPVDKVWAIAKERRDIGAGSFGVRIDDQLTYERFGATCCAIGAVLDGERSDGNEYETAAYLLSTSYEWVVGFVHGFDLDYTEEDGYYAGKDIRRRFEAMGVKVD